MVSSIPDKEILRDLVNRALHLEKIAETGDIWRVYDATEDEGVKGLLFDMKVQSEHHLHVLLEVAEEIGLEVDETELEQKSEERRLIRQGMDLVDVLQQLRKHDKNCADFYKRVAAALRKTDLEDIDEEELAERFDYLARYENDHIQEMSEHIDRLQGPL